MKFEYLVTMEKGTVADDVVSPCVPIHSINIHIHASIIIRDTG